MFMSRQWAPPIKLGKTYPPFSRISIGTTNWCTRRCSFCPMSLFDSTKRDMSDETYEKILIELADFKGVVQWFGLNEPLGDKRNLHRIADLRAIAPRCTIHMSSNGDLLQHENQIQELFNVGLNSLNLNAYDQYALQRLEIIVKRLTGIERRAKHVWGKLSRRKRIISLIDLTQPTGLHSWGNEKLASHPGIKTRPRSQYCARPHRHIVVRWNGEVPLCCVLDPLCHDMIIGNVNEQTLLEIWNEQRMRWYRWNLQQAKRVDLCKGCVEDMAYPHIVVPVIPLPEWTDAH